MLPKIKGTQDFLDRSSHNFLIDTLRKHLTTYNFNEISTPILEPIALFKRSLGLHTEVVNKEMYTVLSGKERSGEKATICLRPEATASTMRAFFNNHIEQRPWKVFSYGPMFRHERPQKGRYRQFHQATMEIIGAANIGHDAELIAMLDRFFSETLKFDSYALLINFLGTLEDRKRYNQALSAFLEEQDNLPKKIIELKDKNILRIFDLKDPQCQEALQDAPIITDYLCDESRQEWEQLRSYLDQLSVSYSVYPRLVRGLDYYNKTVFEFTSSHLGSQSAFCGGGRYDSLSQTLGEKEAVPSLGAALGIERVLMVMEHYHDKLAMPHKPAVQAIIPFSHKQHSLALLCAETLRRNGICCEVILADVSLKSLMRKAHKLHAQHVLLIGDDEQENNYITVKNMVNGTEDKVSHNELIAFFKK